MSAFSTIELVPRSTFIFTGTVVRINQSSVRVLAARPGLAVARFERAIRVNPMLGKLEGRLITIQLAKGAELRTGQRLIFLANSWVHAEEIAVIEVAHLTADTETEKQVADAVAELPKRHLADRVATASVIVMGTVVDVSPAGVREPISEHAAGWMLAQITVSETMKPANKAGKPRQQNAMARNRMKILFPESTDPIWRRYPKLVEKQRAIFLLHPTTLARLPPDTLMLTDPADVQPPAQAKAILGLMKTQNGKV